MCYIILVHSSQICSSTFAHNPFTLAFIGTSPDQHHHQTTSRHPPDTLKTPTNPPDNFHTHVLQPSFLYPLTETTIIDLAVVAR